MTPQDAALLASLTGFTPGPWGAALYETDGLQWDRGSTRVMRGEYFGRAVLAKEPFGAVALVPRCHADHDFDAALIAAAPDLHRIATEQAVEIERLREALEDAEYDLAQWCESAPELIKAGFNMDGTEDVLAKVSAALQETPP